MLYLKLISVRVNQSVFLRGTKLKAQPCNVHPFLIRQKHLKKLWVTVSPSCHIMIRPQNCALRSELCSSALGLGQGNAQHFPQCLHAWLAFHWEYLCVGGRELMSVIWRATDKTKSHFSVYQKWFPPMLNDGSWAWSSLPVGTWWKWGSWHKCKDETAVERVWDGNLRPDIFTYRLFWPCLVSVLRREWASIWGWSCCVWKVW